VPGMAAGDAPIQIDVDILTANGMVLQKGAAILIPDGESVKILGPL
jgi:hypothetical protein